MARAPGPYECIADARIYGTTARRNDATVAQVLPGSGNRLHGVTLERIVTELVARLGWAELGRRIQIRCFTYDPSIKSSLTFLRRTPWARQQVEALYVELADQPSDG